MTISPHFANNKQIKNLCVYSKEKKETANVQQMEDFRFVGGPLLILPCSTAPFHFSMGLFSIFPFEISKLELSGVC